MGFKKITKVMACALAFSMMFSASGCNSNNGTESEVTKGTDTENTAKPEDGEEDNKEESTKKPVAQGTDFSISEEDQKIYDSLFNISNDVKVKIDIEEEELKKIQQDYDKYDSFGSKSPIYRKCNLTIIVNGEEYYIEEVGVRMKGNTSRKSFYNYGSGVYALIHMKFSFDETFDNKDYYGDEAKVWESEEARKERKDRTFASLSGLEMKWNNTTDGTYMREAYAFNMYRDNGLLAPQTTLSKCEVNGESWGIYKFYEPVDKTFIERNLPKEEWGGDLYKCSWASGPANYKSTRRTIGVEDEDNRKFYTYDLKTNKKDSQHEQLKNMINIVSKRNAKLEDIKTVVDTDYWVKFMAVSYLLGLPDDLRNNYNNHYVYFKGNTGQAIFIAYDCDHIMGTNCWNPTGDYMTTTDPYSDIAYGAGEQTDNRLVINTIAAEGLLVNEYTDALKEILDGKWFTYENFQEMFNAAYKNHGDYGIPEKQFNNIDAKYMVMSIDDTLEDGNSRNNNMQVEEYMKRMRENCISYIEMYQYGGKNEQ